MFGVELTEAEFEGFRGLIYRVAGIRIPGTKRIMMTNRLRTEGTDHLLSAGQAVGVQRFVAQSFFAAYERTGGPVKTEDDSFGPHPAKEMRETVAAIRHVEDSVLAASWTQGIVLRYGGFYGSGTSLGPEREQTEAVRRRRRKPVLRSPGAR